MVVYIRNISVYIIPSPTSPSSRKNDGDNQNSMWSSQFYNMAKQPPVGQGILIVEDDHTQTRHTR